MPCVVVTGGPGAGKTTLLAELARRGFTTVPESARAIISERLGDGLCPRPEPAAFAGEILRRDAEKFELHRHCQEWVFFDRGVIEAIGMLDEATPLSSIEVQFLVDRYPFHPTIFVLPPWESIYVNDAERDQNFAESIRVHMAVVSWYKATGYHIVTVPPATAAQRADHVLSALGRSAV